jgi:hypothetical protein
MQPNAQHLRPAVTQAGQLAGSSAEPPPTPVLPSQHEPRHPDAGKADARGQMKKCAHVEASDLSQNVSWTHRDPLLQSNA